MGGGAAEEAAPAVGADDEDPVKAGDEAACPDEFGVVGADVAAAGADEAAGDAEEPDAAAEEPTPAGVVALPDPYPVGVLRGAN